MTLSELIEQVCLLLVSLRCLTIGKFDLGSLTHRRNILDPAKLKYLNKHHLMRSVQSDQATARHARRTQEFVKSAFPLR